MKLKFRMKIIGVAVHITVVITTVNIITIHCFQLKCALTVSIELSPVSFALSPSTCVSRNFFFYLSTNKAYNANASPALIHQLYISILAFVSDFIYFAYNEAQHSSTYWSVYIFTVFDHSFTSFSGLAQSTRRVCEIIILIFMQ